MDPLSEHELSPEAAQQPYDPAQVLPGSNQFLHLLSRFRDNDHREYAWVQLTAATNDALRSLCHSLVQREVWSWPCYAFPVRVINGELCLKATYLRPPHPARINALLIASCGIPMPSLCAYSNDARPFAGNLRLPGTFNGVCANCKWYNRTTRCTLGNRYERRYIPLDTGQIPLPSRLERLVD